jgi:diguanylate cyclase (GGDEF)-like protein
MMLSTLRKEFSGSRSVVAMLIAAAAGALLFTLIAGALVYNTTQRLISANRWVQHTQEVLNSLQRASLLTERVDHYWRLYLLTNNDEQLNRARSSLVVLNTAVAHLRTAVNDNQGQQRNIDNLTTCAASLARALDSAAPRSSTPELAIQQCQQTIGLMSDQEQSLLNERNQSSQQSSFTSIATEFAFVALSLLTLFVLFAFLMRDAIRRQREGSKLREANEHLAQTVEALEDRARESAQLNTARDELQLCVAVDQVVASGANSIAQLLPGTRGAICMLDEKRRSVEPCASWSDPALTAFTPIESCCGLRSGQPRWRIPGASEIHCTHFAGSAPARYLCNPISAHGRTLGILYVECDTDELVVAVRKRLESVHHLLQIAGMAIATLNLQARLESQSLHDPLTGLSNRRFLEASLERELHRAKRRKNTLAVFMIDADHFKRFNDSFGHAAGDAALKAIASVLRTNVRAEDIACRYGGEEFTLILPDIAADLAYSRAESIRRQITELSVSVGSETYADFSVSIGIAFFPIDGLTAESLLQKADQALYESKRLGRNQISLAKSDLLEV